METQTKKVERIDIRVSSEEKEMFCKAHRLSGEKSFTDFITRIIKAQSVQIIEANEKILASERDKEIFFKAIFSEQEPSQTVIDAANRFKLTLKTAN